MPCLRLVEFLPEALYSCFLILSPVFLVTSSLSFIFSFSILNFYSFLLSSSELQLVSNDEWEIITEDSDSCFKVDFFFLIFLALFLDEKSGDFIVPLRLEVLEGESFEEELSSSPSEIYSIFFC